jgi:xanthine dehydrogenase molybdopterin-binding subunit B
MGKAELPLHAPGTKVDRGYIGESVPRPNAARLLQGRGAFTDDLRFPRLAHVVFFRSPYAHALIKKLNLETASSVCSTDAPSPSTALRGSRCLRI